MNWCCVSWTKILICCLYSCSHWCAYIEDYGWYQKKSDHLRRHERSTLPVPRSRGLSIRQKVVGECLENSRGHHSPQQSRSWTKWAKWGANGSCGHSTRPGSNYYRALAFRPRRGSHATLPPDDAQGYAQGFSGWAKRHGSWYWASEGPGRRCGRYYSSWGVRWDPRWGVAELNLWDRLGWKLYCTSSKMRNWGTEGPETWYRK